MTGPDPGVRAAAPHGGRVPNADAPNVDAPTVVLPVVLPVVPVPDGPVPDGLVPHVHVPLQPDAAEAPTEQLPTTSTIGPATSRPASLGRSSGLMAVANLVSRLTGFVRQIVLYAVLGKTVLNDSYTISTTLPSIVYELLLGGVLSSVLIPLLVRARAEDVDGGAAYTRRLFTLTATALLAATALAMVAAPLLTRLYLGGEATSTANPELATALAYLLLPQILFYGLGALLGAMLNSRGNFGPFAWAPVLNNVVVVAVLGVYVLVPGELSLDPVRMGEPKLLVLGLGPTLGIAVQALVLVPAARRMGFSFRPLWGWDPRMSTAGGLASWAVVYVLIGQAGYVVTTRVATASDAGAYANYANAWLLLQVPYGVLGVSLLTALMPRMSRAAAEGRSGDVVADLALGSRLLTVLLVPVSVLLTAFGPQIGIALFGLRSGNVAGATQLGATLAVSAFGLLPYGITMLQLRVFYSLTDSRTPTLIQLFTVAVKIPLLLLAGSALPPEQVVLGLAAANGVSFVAGAVLGQLLLRRRLGAIPTRAVLGTVGRTVAAAAVGGVAAVGVVTLLPLDALAPLPRAWSELVVALVVLTPVTVVGMVVLRVRELDAALNRLGRLRRKGRHEATR